MVESHSNFQITTISWIHDNRTKLLCTLSYCFTFIGLGISITGFGPTLLELGSLTNSTEEHMGYIFTVKGFGYLLGSMTGRLYHPFFQYLFLHLNYLKKKRYDKFDGHKLLFGAILLSASSFIAVPLISTIWGQGLIWFAIGGFTGSVDTGANTLIVWVWKEKVNPFMQLLHFSFGVGALLSPVIIALLQEKALFWQYLALAIPFGAAAIPVLFNASPLNTSTQRADVELQETVVAKQSLASSTDDLNLPSEIEVTEAVVDVPTSSLSPTILRKLRIEAVIFAALLLLLDVGAEIGYGGWLFTYAHEQLKFSDKDSAYVNAAFWGSFTLGRLAAVGISLKLTPKTMLFSDIIGCSISLAFLIIFPSSRAALWICSVGFGFSIASVFPTVISLPQNLGVEITGTDTSWMVVGASTGEMVVPLLIGTLRAKVAAIMLIVVVLSVEMLGAMTFSVLLLRVKYLKGELSGSLASIIRHRISGDKFSRLRESDGSDTLLMS